MLQIAWTRSVEEASRVFLFSPRFNRIYLLQSSLAANGLCTSLLGLPESRVVEALADPAATVAVSGRFEKPAQPVPHEALPDAGRLLPALYLFIHRFRFLASLARTIACITLLRKLRREARRIEIGEIGRIVQSVEVRAGVSDCYPRAIITAWLCSQAGLGCKITVGILAPTKLLHAWCSVDGVIPYEPVQRHWLFRPLLIFDVAA
jgi:hypothetical protein